MSENSSSLQGQTMLRFVILIDFEQSFQVIMRCLQNTKIHTLLGELGKVYDPIVRRKVVFREKRCYNKVSIDELIRNGQSYYINLTQTQYQLIIKALFFTKKSSKNVEKELRNVGKQLQQLEKVLRNSLNYKSFNSDALQSSNILSNKEESLNNIKENHPTMQIRNKVKRQTSLKKELLTKNHNMILNKKDQSSTHETSELEQPRRRGYYGVESSETGQASKCCSLI